MFVKIQFQKEKNNKFINFRKKYLNLTTEVRTKDELNILNEEFDIFITGSDQVWNYNITDGDMTYLLDFADIEKRNSYAASFGIIDIDEKYRNEYKKLLNTHCASSFFIV